MSRINSAAFDDLNAEQRAAVEHGLEPLLVIAGAGSGKTKTLSCRVAHLVANGADPSRILLLTFSRRAASEMIARVGTVLSSLPLQGGGTEGGGEKLGAALSACDSQTASASPHPLPPPR